MAAITKNLNVSTCSPGLPGQIYAAGSPVFVMAEPQLKSVNTNHFSPFGHNSEHF